MTKKALKDGLLTQKQYDKLPEALLEGIVKSKRKNGVKGKAKPEVKANPKVKPSGEVRKGKRRKKKKGAK